MNGTVGSFENEFDVVDEPKPLSLKFRVKIVWRRGDEGDKCPCFQETGQRFKGSRALATEWPRGSLLPRIVCHAADTIGAVGARRETVHEWAGV